MERATDRLTDQLTAPLVILFPPIASGCLDSRKGLRESGYPHLGVDHWVVSSIDQLT